MKQVLLFLFWLISLGVFAQEICNNDIDDDSDGLIDCADGECFGAGHCPTVFDQMPGVCEDTPGGGSAIVDLTTYEPSITGGTPHTVNWYQDTSAIGNPITPISTPATYSATDGNVVFAEVDNGTNQDIASVTFTVNGKPTATDQTPVVCEDAFGSGQTTVDLTALEAAIDGGAGYLFNWFENAGLTTPIAAPASYLVSDGQVAYALADDGSCTNTATVTYTVNALPDASFSYSGTTYCPTDVNPTPTVTTPGGTFSSPTGLGVNGATGEIDLAGSPSGDHTVTYTVSGTCTDSATFDISIIDMNEPTAQPADNITCDAFTAIWHPVFGASNYEVDVAENLFFGNILASYNASSTTDTFLDVTGLTAATTYFYRVRAVTSCGMSFSSDTISVDLLDIPATPVPNLIASNPNCNGFKVSWNAVTYAASYLLEVSQDGFATTDLSQTIPSTSLTLAGLSVGTTYEFRVTPQNVCGSGPSATGTYQTSDVPATPTNAVVINTVCDGADIGWDATATATDYQIEIDDDPAFGSIDLLQVTATPNFTATGLSAGITYYGRVSARNSCGAGISAVLTFTTDSLPTAPLNVGAIAEYNQATLHWDTVMVADMYTVEVASDALFSSLVSTATVDSTQALATGLTPLMTYYGRVLASNSCGNSPSSDTIVFTTPQDSLIIDSLALVALYNATNGLGWTDNTNWLSGTIDTWQGVTVADHRVTRLEVGNNQLSGNFPTAMINLTALVYADFRGNELTGNLGEWISNFQETTDSLRLSGNQFTEIDSSLPLTQGVIEIDDNQFTFSALLPIVAALPRVLYAPQALIGSTSNTFRETGDSYTLSLGIDASVPDNQYVWFRDGAAVDTTTTNQYVLDPIIISHDGVHTCQVTNPNVPGLVLESNPMTVNVQAQANSLTFSPIADVAYGSEPFVLNAVSTSGLPAYFEAIEGDSLVNLEGDLVTTTGVGEVTIRATQPGDDFYGAATPVTQKFTIGRGSQTIAFTAINDQNIALTDSVALIISASSGLPIEFSVEGAAELRDSMLLLLDTGTVTVTASQSGNLIYEAALPVSQSFLVYTSDTIPPNPNDPDQTDDSFTVNVQLSGMGQYSTVTASLHRATGSGFTREQEQLFAAGSGAFTEVVKGFYSLRLDPDDEAYFSTYSGNQLILAQASILTLLQDTTLTPLLLAKPDTSAQTGVQVHGTLMLESTEGGRILEEVALPGVPVYFVQKTNQTIVGYGMTNSAGAFTFPNIPPGSYYFLADYEGMELQKNLVEVTDTPLALVAIAEQIITLRSTDEVKPADPITSISENNEVAIAAYPNPTRGLLTLEIPAPWIEGHLIITDISGKQVVSTTLSHMRSTLDLEALPAGLYYLRVQKSDQSYSTKLMKK
ncbi:MAG: fibronectin type III domain-containing protein [Cyclobacteriaceae bacterium]